MLGSASDTQRRLGVGVGVAGPFGFEFPSPDGPANTRRTTLSLRCDEPSRPALRQPSGTGASFPKGRRRPLSLTSGGGTAFVRKSAWWPPSLQTGRGTAKRGGDAGALRRQEKAAPRPEPICAHEEALNYRRQRADAPHQRPQPRLHGRGEQVSAHDGRPQPAGDALP